jgi:hybrid cluster-associated redox disulfide protein
MRVHRAASSLSQRNEHPGNQMQHVRFQAWASGMKHKFSDDATMDEIMHLSPAAIRVVLQHGMLCVGCPIASFHTVSDAAREHDLNEEQLGSDLRAAIESTNPD